MTAPKTPMEALDDFRHFQFGHGAKQELLELLSPFIGKAYGGEYTDKPANLTDAELNGLATGTHVVVPKDELQRQFKAGYECGGNGA